MKFLNIDKDNLYYQQERELRKEVLVRPLGLPENISEIDDNNAYHFVVIEDEKVIGCTILVRIGAGELKLRQMAVDPSFQKQGVGKLIIEGVIDFSKKKGYSAIICDARQSAIDFYVKNGFIKEGEEFIQVGIPHYQMKIQLN